MVSSGAAVAVVVVVVLALARFVVVVVALALPRRVSVIVRVWPGCLEGWRSCDITTLCSTIMSVCTADDAHYITTPSLRLHSSNVVDCTHQRPQDETTYRKAINKIRKEINK